MKTNSLFWALSWVAAGSLAIVQGCGGDDDDGGGSAGKGGKGGTGGSTGGSTTGGRGGTGTGGSTGGSTTGGSNTGGATGGSTTGGTGTIGGEGGLGGEGGGEAGGGSVDPDVAAACTIYCTSYYAANCDDFDTDTYTNEADCNSTCAGMTLGTPGQPGDTIHCRLGHAGLAEAAQTANDEPGRELHCGHSSEDPTDVCI